MRPYLPHLLNTPKCYKMSGKYLETPRKYQIDAIYQLAIRKVEMLYLIRKTGDGKSLVLLGLATILRGVTISMVPLVGLGSDQDSNSDSQEGDVLSFHIDDFFDKDMEELKKLLLDFAPEDGRSIILYISPQNLQPDSKWYQTMQQLAKDGSISAICIDEVHAVVECHDEFRPEFQSAIETINSLVKMSKEHNDGKLVPLLVMSATFRRKDQRQFNSMISRKPSAVIWGEMKRRGTRIAVQVVGDISGEIKKQMEVDFEHNSERRRAYIHELCHQGRKFSQKAGREGPQRTRRQSNQKRDGAPRRKRDGAERKTACSTNLRQNWSHAQGVSHGGFPRKFRRLECKHHALHFCSKLRYIEQAVLPCL